MSKTPPVALSAEDEPEDGETGLTVPDEADTEASLTAEEQQGNWPDLDRLRISQPQKVKFAVWLLEKGVSIRQTCKLARLSASTVCAITRDPVLGPSIASQKAQVTSLVKAALRVGLESKLEQWSAEGAKPPDVFDLKLLGDMAALADGGATQRVEHVHTIMNPNTSATLRLLEAGAVTATNPIRYIDNPFPDGVVMGSESQKLHALPPVAEADLVPDGIGDCEESPEI